MRCKIVRNDDDDDGGKNGDYFKLLNTVHHMHTFSLPPSRPSVLPPPPQKKKSAQTGGIPSYVWMSGTHLPGSSFAATHFAMLRSIVSTAKKKLTLLMKQIHTYLV